MKQSKVTSHIHARIAKLAEKAFNAGLILQCERTTNDTYLVRKFNDLVESEYNPIATGCILVALLHNIANSK